MEVELLLTALGLYELSANASENASETGILFLSAWRRIISVIRDELVN